MRTIKAILGTMMAIAVMTCTFSMVVSAEEEVNDNITIEEPDEGAEDGDEVEDSTDDKIDIIVGNPEQDVTTNGSAVATTPNTGDVGVMGAVIAAVSAVTGLGASKRNRK